MSVAAFLGVDLGGDVAPVDDDELATATTRRGHQATRRDSATATASVTSSSERLETDVAMLELEPETVRCGAGGDDELGVGRL